MTLLPPRPRRRLSLTPMIDVVFLLLVFFMLAARFGVDTGLTLGSGGTGAVWQGPPRLIEVTPDALRLNGIAVTEDGLAAALAPLLTGTDPVVLRARDGATVQRIVTVIAVLQGAGVGQILMVD